MHRNIGIGSNGVDWLCSLRKIPTWLRVTNFCIDCTSSVCFASSFMQLLNDPKCNQILQNIPKHYFRVQLGGLGLSIAKKSRHHFVVWIFALIARVHRVLHRVSCSYETIPNASKHYETHQNMSLGSMGWVTFVAKNCNMTSWDELLY